MVCVVRCDVPGMRVSAARLVGYITDYVFYAMLRAPPGRRYSDFGHTGVHYCMRTLPPTSVKISITTRYSYSSGSLLVVYCCSLQ